MTVSRRDILGAAALLGAAGAFGLHRMAGQGGAPAPRVVIYDSRKPASLAYARSLSGVTRIDLAQEQAANWRSIRALDRQGPVAGVTGWTDYVAARGWLEQRGLRVAVQDHDRQHDLIRWTMG
ncbi:MAG TPA: twin-arginine translocation signal domain-containing protein [Sphingobium sp.]|nr:twin-arginine translocation signal domain-containing protein [Sphingobium sp.]